MLARPSNKERALKQRKRLLSAVAIAGLVATFTATTPYSSARADDGGSERRIDDRRTDRRDDQHDQSDDRDDGGERDRDDRERSFSVAMIGDIPYGDAQIALFPQVIAQINADRDVRLVTHLGDIKSGSSRCDDSYFAFIRSSFDKFVDPLVYTPGDNEWTDCHRVNNGAYDPLERLAMIRSVFFTTPDRTLGQKAMKLRSQASMGFPENVRYDRADVTFAAIHIVGSNNGLANWTGQSAPTAFQLAEVRARTAAALKMINDTFEHADDENSRAVVLQIQADMFDPTLPSTPTFAQWSGFQAIVQSIAARSAAFGKPVYLFDGDSHVYTVDRPLASESAWPSSYGTGSWRSFYGVTTPAPNLTRITVDGSTGLNNWLKVTVHENGPEVLSWTRVPFSP